MAGITNAYSNVLLNYLTGVGEYSHNIMLAGLLFKSGDVEGVSVGTTSLGELPAGDGYDREELAAGNWGSASGGSITRSSSVTFGAATADWGTVDGVGIYTAAGVLAWFAYFDEPVTVANGDTLVVGPFTLALD